MSLPRRPPSRSLWLASLACAFAACSDDDGGGTAPTEPPTLNITGFVSFDGSELRSFAPEAPVAEPCDGHLTVVVGPTDGAGRLLNWDLRPPGACGRIRQCGYVAVRLLGADGVEVANGAAASTRIPVDVAGLPPGAGYSVVAELRQGTSGEVFTTADEETREQVPVTAEQSLTLDPGTCPDSGASGGSAGASGSGGLGGLGGQGGAAGAPG